jgi:hypothetical protein
MAKRGPKPKYDPIFAGHARRLCMLGATMQELADYFGVARCTIATWSAQYPDFGQAVNEGRLTADSVLAERLYEKAKGYEVQTERLVQIDGEWKPVTYTRRMPPDTQALTFWLRNRRPQNWRETVEHRHVDVDKLLAELEAAGERARNARRG